MCSYLSKVGRPWAGGVSRESGRCHPAPDKPPTACCERGSRTHPARTVLHTCSLSPPVHTRTHLPGRSGVCTVTNAQRGHSGGPRPPGQHLHGHKAAHLQRTQTDFPGPRTPLGPCCAFLTSANADVHPRVTSPGFSPSGKEILKLESFESVALKGLLTRKKREMSPAGGNYFNGKCHLLMMAPLLWRQQNHPRLVPGARL